jgi:hypothetical protein
MPYRASLSGIFGSGVQAPTPRQPLVDVGSIVSAISGGIEAHTQRLAMRAQLARQAALDAQTAAHQTFEQQRQSAADARAAELHAQQLETERTNRRLSLAKAVSEGYQPGGQPVDFSGVPGMSGIGADVTGVQTQDTFDPTRGATFRLEQAKYARDRADKVADEERRQAAALELERLRGGFQLRSAQSRGQQGQDGSPMGEQRKFQREQALGDDFRNAAKPFQQVADNIGVIRAAGPAALKGDPQGQMSIIYGFMKLQDPGSTVREGEYASAQNAGSVPEKVRAQYNKVLSGEFLDPSQVQRFLDQTEVQSKAWQQRFAPLRDQYRRRAQAWQVDPENVVYDYFAPVNAGGGAPAKPVSSDNPWRR